MAPGMEALSPDNARAVAAAKPAFLTVPKRITGADLLLLIFNFLVISSYSKPSPIMVIKQIADILPRVFGSSKKTLRLSPITVKMIINNPQFTIGPLNLNIYLSILVLMNNCDKISGTIINSPNTIISLKG